MTASVTLTRARPETRTESGIDEPEKSGSRDAAPENR